jgi:hypothetical protein
LIFFCRKYDLAVEAFTTAISLIASNPATYCSLAFVYQLKGDFEMVLKQNERTKHKNKNKTKKRKTKTTKKHSMAQNQQNRRFEHITKH